MATKGLTPVARRASRDFLSGPKLVGQEPDLRELLVREDARAVWDRIQVLIRSLDPTAYLDLDQVTQDVFVCLLATDRIGAYLREDYSEDEIVLDLLSILSNDVGRSPRLD
jgi:hypothetical protein